MTQAPLLPSNASELERDLSLSQDSLTRLSSGPPKIRTGKRLDIQDDVIPWLILEYGLGELLPYIPDQRQAVREGVKWQRVRGTPAAVRTALGWIGFDAQIEESERGSIRWADFQLGLDQAPNGLQFTENVVQVSRLSSPVRSRLFRIYGGWYDFRRFKLDDHGLSTGSWLCDHTGVYLEQDREIPWPQLSFGRELQRTHSFTETFTAGTSLHRKRTDLGFYEDRLILDFNQLSELVWRTFHMDVAKACISRMHFMEWGPIWQRATDWAMVAWDATFDWANKINAITPALKFCKAGMYLSDQDAKLGDTNACLPATDVVEVGDGPLVLSEADSETGVGVLSEHVSRLEYQEILERLERQTESGSMWVSGSNSQTQTEIFPLTHGQAYASTAHPNPPAHATLITSLSYNNFTLNNRASYSDHVFGDGAGHRLGDNAEMVRHGETRKVFAYDDIFRLDQTLLSERKALVQQYSNTRDHTTSSDRTFVQSSQWQTAIETWASVGDWQSEPGWFDVVNESEDWLSTYSWNTYPQFERVHEETEAELDLSEGNNVFGDLNYRLGSFYNVVEERFTQTTVATLSFQPNLLSSLDREHKRIIPYEDKFTLDLHRLSEFLPLVNQMGTLREHTTGFVQAQVQSGQWEFATLTWANQLDWQSESWFDLGGPPDESWLSTYSWTNFNQLEQFFEETISEVELSEAGAFGDLNFLLGSEFSSISERFTQTEVNALIAQPSLVGSLDREHKRILPYNDTFELDLNRLDEFIPLVSFQSNVREHADETNISRRFQTLWTDSSFEWNAANNDWQSFGWYQEEDELSWVEVYSWVDTPALQRYTRHAKAAIVLSDSDPLSSTNATLGWYSGDERFDRDYHAIHDYRLATFETRQHVRSVQTTVLWLPSEIDWNDTNWSGPAAPDWANSEETWNDDPTDGWDSVDWTQSSVDWGDLFMWATIKRWTVLSTVVESKHTTI